MLRSLFLVAVIFFASVSTLRAADSTSAPINQPDLVSFGLGWINFDKDEARRQAPDFRAEYRWGISLLPLISPYFKSWDSDVQFHPFVGGEATAYAQFYGLGGLAVDWYISRHWVLTWSEGAGAFDGGDAVRMGSFVEFRSQLEAGWRFDNDVRFTFEGSHISNAKITTYNPGSEIIGFYLHIPFDNIMGKKQ